MSERPTDWTNQPETDLFSIIGTKKGKHGKKKNKNIYSPYSPGATKDTGLSVAMPSASGPGIAGSTKSKGMYAPPASGVGSGRSTGPGGQSISSDLTSPGRYSQGVSSVTRNAPTGSLAGGIGDMAVHSVGSDPYSTVNQYYIGKGMNSDSNTAQLALSLYNPQDKAYGIMGGQGFSSDIDAINFGEQLLNQFSTGTGQQLNGIEMVKTALSALAQEFKNPGQGKGVGNMLTMIALEPDPASQINSIMGILQGILQGTMPDDSMKALMAQMQRAASGFASRWQRSRDIGGMEKSGQNIASDMLQWLDGAF